ncbi:hypothetical protein AURDEDRAFT_131018 [Auricularia subglabra TFB-10046 SS5]|nr:hypothetical protein AURDEDRAFT_131018 [Auricularia subglabra TFB-10046 SS5]
MPAVAPCHPGRTSQVSAMPDRAPLRTLKSQSRAWQGKQTLTHKKGSAPGLPDARCRPATDERLDHARSQSAPPSGRGARLSNSSGAPTESSTRSREAGRGRAPARGTALRSADQQDAPRNGPATSHTKRKLPSRLVDVRTRVCRMPPFAAPTGSAGDDGGVVAWEGKLSARAMSITMKKWENRDRTHAARSAARVRATGGAATGSGLSAAGSGGGTGAAAAVTGSSAGVGSGDGEW